MSEIFRTEARADRSPGCLGAQPRKLTVADLLALVAGFAIAFALPPIVDLGGIVYHGIGISLPAWAIVAIMLTTFVLWLEVAIALVVLVRCFQYGSMPRPAEWLAMIIALWTFSQVLPNVDGVISGIYPMTGTLNDFWLWRWRIAGGALAVVLAGFLILLALRRVLPSGLRTLLLGAMALMLLWGPLPVLSMQFDSLFPPLTGLGNGWCFWFALSSLRGIGHLPFALLFGVPAMATYFAWRRRRGRSWVWTEWVGGGSALMLASAWIFMFYFGSYEWPSTGWICERIVTTVGLVLTAVLSAQLVHRRGSAGATMHEFAGPGA